MKTLLSLGLFLVVFLFSGCAPKVQITLLPEDNGKTGVITIADSKGEKHTIDQAYAALDVSQKGDIASKQETQESVQSKYAEVLNAMPSKPQSYLFFFSFDSANLDTKQFGELKTIAQLIKDEGVVDVICIGHSDSAGDKEYNKTLSLLRAKTVAEKLMTYGVAKSLIELRYYGDADPLVVTANNKANAKNRRVEIILK